MSLIEVILNKNIKNIGFEGDVKLVKFGYAKNFLIPSGLAVLRTYENLKKFELMRDAISKRKKESLEKAKLLSGKINGFSLDIYVKVSQSGSLFGSITKSVVLEKLLKQSIELDSSIIVDFTPIKSLGSYTIKCVFCSGVVSSFKVNILDEKVMVGKNMSKNKSTS